MMLENLQNIVHGTSFLAAEEIEPKMWVFAYAAFLVVIIFGVAAVAKKGFRPAVFVGFPAKCSEQLYYFLNNMASDLMGQAGTKYTPLLYNLWVYVFFANVMGLVLNVTPTADWSANIGLAIITMVYVEYEGIRQNGVFGHLKHFAGPKLEGVLVLISVFLFVVEFISELMKLFSLSIRLYGNIHGGHLAVGALNGMIPVVPVLGGLLLPIKFFTCVLQAFVWVVLTCTYLSMVTSHGDEDHEPEESSHPVAGSVTLAA